MAVALIGGSVAPASGAPPAATPFPEASPVAADPCAALAPFFEQVATLAADNEGLAIMQRAGHDVLALGDDEAVTVVTELDALIASIDGIDAPEPARAWQAAYLALLRWYRDMAASRDPLALQRIINNDRRLFGNLSTAQLQGQQACPKTWDSAWSAAFGE